MHAVCISNVQWAEINSISCHLLDHKHNKTNNKGEWCPKTTKNQNKAKTNNLENERPSWKKAPESSTDWEEEEGGGRGGTISSV